MSDLMTLPGAIDARVLAGLAREFRAAGLDMAALRARAGVDRLEAPEAGGAHDLDTFVRLLEAAGDAGDRPGFLWHCGRAFARNSAAGLFPMLHAGLRLGTALGAVVGEIGRLQSGAVVRLSHEAGLATIEYRVLDPAIWPRARDVEFTFGFLDGLVRSAGPVVPEAVVFEHDPHGRLGRIDRVAGLPCVYGGGSNYLAYPDAAMELSLRPGALARGGPGGVASPPREAAFAGTLRAALLEALGRAPVSQAAVAAGLGLSDRSLRRRLEAEGLSFRTELDRARSAVAREYLRRGEMPLSEIAQRLGYRHLSDFSRAFRRVEGIAPSRLRKR
ncbi:AraC family transcriptional regulator (plasmid) [Paroceanicella profunda]|uniref:AraC family transcriptional regulator n=1 Tax=Paroceanicella profunda TaxID=2579971 RepID=A0A5B8FIH7_9RHOB|nr:AraC family transcriptional regulator [Paroceanicella profunda]QDL93821.1 AraC family transcriptional regulator [Paroceanicella profunda]